ncbi:recombinase RecT [Alkalicoccobacillus plakortidis]|uniref:Recombinase RecT n=1 Tax=Alkalicoccobacillus plakortidis TaxID=444060 RepID=A0ABT0XIL1_9BACI|nr:recombinase RecT [Alkalicoccobacillus plakortidis]MCM2675600.1 recombinase RecT [Alkalicoccobacillus plakortidis]
MAIQKAGIVDTVSDQIRTFRDKGQLSFPTNYEPENALKSAWLTLQDTNNKNGVCVLESCDKNSIASALLDMVVQGLTPAKKQGYFIAYGRNLVFQRSYFGTMAVTQRVTGAKSIVAQVVYADDDFDYEILPHGKKVNSHKQKLGNINKDKIIGAYCTITFPDETSFTEVMSFEEIQQSWKMSRSKESNTHKDFTQEMAKKTVTNRTCKKFINSSDDSSLVVEHFNKSDAAISEAQVGEEISENANLEFIDAEYEDVPDDPEPEVEIVDEPVNEQPKEDEFAKKDDGPDF